MITDQDIETVSTTILSSDNQSETGRGAYLRHLIDATQEELKRKKGHEAETQLTALKAVHTRFYEIVLRIAEGFVPKGTKDRAVELHRRANFARTALGAARTHIRAGGDIVALSAAKVTKAALRARAGPKPASARRLKGLAERQSKKLMAVLLGLADADKTAAVEEMQLLLGQLTTQLVALGVAATKDAAQAYAEQRPFKVGKMLFAPTMSQVIAAQARPQ